MLPFGVTNYLTFSHTKYDMVNHMKTTIQIPDSLYEEVRKLARREGTTMKAWGKMTLVDTKVELKY
jgi:hypothetical protein